MPPVVAVVALGGRPTREGVAMLVVDAANVIGSRPNGWWRDRPGAASAFTDAVRTAVAAGSVTAPVTIVLEGQSRRGAPEADLDRVTVVHAAGAGDDTIVATARAHVDAGSSVVVVTADRALADRVQAVGAAVVGPSWLLERLDR